MGKMLIIALIFALPVCGLAAENHWLHEKSDDGGVVILEDGSTWKVDPTDRIDSSLWLPTEDIVVTDDGDKLINVDSGDEVDAERIE